MSKRKGQAKLTSAIVEAIRNAKEWRGIVTALAIQYGVSHSMISMIRAGKRWTADPMTEERFKPDGLYAMHGSVLNAIWRDIYLPLITDDGTPTTAIKATAAATWRSVSARCSKAMQSRWKRNEYGPFISSDWRRPVSGQHSAERCKLSLMVGNYPSTRRAASQNAHGKTSCAMAG
jgi:hypothetical protein